jgi:hypothetical protein
MICEVCGKEHDGSYGSGRFCSRSCGCKYSAISRSKECLNFIKQKVQNSKSLSKERKQKEYEATPKVCKNCGETYYKNWAKTVKSEFCSRECARSYSTKIKRDEISKKVSDKLKGRLVGNALNTKGLKGVNNKNVSVEELRIEYSKNPNKCEFCGKELSYERRQRKTCSRKCQDELWKLWLKTNKTMMAEKGFGGGYRKGSVRSRYGYYKGIYCASTYELVFLIYSLEHNISIERNTKFFEYELNGEIKHYLPDFKIGNKYVEIKNYNREDVIAKTNALLDKGEIIEVLYYDDLEHMMCYIDTKYGTFHNRSTNNYQTLYDDYKPKYTFICEHCGKEVSKDRKVGKMRFCSRECGAAHGHSANTDVIDKDKVIEVAVPVPGYEGFWYSKDCSLFSSNIKRKDGKWLKCRLSISKSGRKEYKIKNKRFSIESLNSLCNFDK